MPVRELPVEPEAPKGLFRTGIIAKEQSVILRSGN